MIVKPSYSVDNVDFHMAATSCNIFHFNFMVASYWFLCVLEVVGDFSFTVITHITYTVTQHKI